MNSNTTDIYDTIQKNVPADLKGLPQWVAWSRAAGKNGRSLKIPIAPGSGKAAKVNDPGTWASFNQALDFCRRQRLAGVGFMFSAEDEFAGIDLDDCIDPDTGAVNDDARKIVSQIESYTEISPSGSGLHILVRGELPPGPRRKGKIELYDSRRFFTVTGRLIAGAPAAAMERTAELQNLHKELFNPPLEKFEPKGIAAPAVLPEAIMAVQAFDGEDKLGRLFRAAMELCADLEPVLEEHLFPDEADFVPPAAYCSYLFGSMAAGPAISVWWYEKAQIEKLIEKEIETGVRCFPRYTVQDPLRARIDGFCWENRVHFEYLEAAGLPFELSEVFLSSEKKRITRAVDFLILIDTVHAAELPVLAQGGFQGFLAPPMMSSGLIAPDESSSDRLSILKHEKLSGRVWAAFHADWMQALLENLAEDFITDYLDESGRIGCSLAGVWALKQSYLKSLYDAVSSRRKREKIRERADALLLWWFPMI